MQGPSYIEQSTKLPLSEDTSFNQDTLTCYKGVWNRGITLYTVHLRLFIVLLTAYKQYTVMIIS